MIVHYFDFFANKKINFPLTSHLIFLKMYSLFHNPSPIRNFRIYPARNMGHTV